MNKLVLIQLMIFSYLCAETYYVRTDGSNSNNGLTNSAGGAWLTIDYAADNVSAGDTVLVQSGTYGERVTPGVNGTSGNVITFYGGGNATVCGWDFSGNDYIRVIGFTIDTDAGGCSENNGCVNMGGISNDYLEFWGNTFRDGNYNGIRAQIDATAYNNSLVIGNTFLNFGIGNGSGVAIHVRGDNNLFAYNEIYNVEPDCFYLMGEGNILYNNYGHDPDPYITGGHVDFIQHGSSTWGLINVTVEGNIYIDDPTGREHHHIVQISNSQYDLDDPDGVVWRYNIFHNIGTYG